MKSLKTAVRTAAGSLRSLKARLLLRDISEAVSTPALARYLRNGFTKIEGWCGGPQTFLVLDVLAELQPRSCRDLGAAEIGVHHGLFFIGLHNLCEAGSPSLALDLFELQHLNIDESGCGNKEELLKNLRSYARDPNRCIVHDGIDSLSISDVYTKELKRKYGSFRFFSVDGGHTADHCSKDLRTAAQLTAPGGIVILDDSFSYEWPGVTEGMFRYLEDPNSSLVPFGVSSKKAFFTQAQFAAEYKDGLEYGLRKRKVGFWTKETEISGRVVSVVVFS